MKIKQDRQIYNFGATSELSKEILSRVAQKLNPTKVDGAVSEHARQYLSSFSTWATSQGVSDEMKQFMLPLPQGHQSSYPDAAGLEKTVLTNSLFDEAMKNVVEEMYAESNEEVNFSDEENAPGDNTTGAIGAAALGLPTAIAAYVLEENPKKKLSSALLAGSLSAGGGYYLGKHTKEGAEYAGKAADFFKAKNPETNEGNTDSAKDQSDQDGFSGTTLATSVVGTGAATALAAAPSGRRLFGRVLGGAKDLYKSYKAAKTARSVNKTAQMLLK